jgi:uncharacterized protein (TIGR02453 family)
MRHYLFDAEVYYTQYLMTTIHPSTLKFLKDLSKHNDRDWFNAYKADYLDAQQNMADFVDALIKEMNKHDELDNTSGKKSLFRIYNDVRFSKDKSPYNVRFAFSLSRSTKLKRGGYYMHIKPGGSYLGCGFFGPNPADLNRIRLDISGNYDQWNKLLRSKSLVSNFEQMAGSKVSTAPRGFDITHPAIDLLRHKQFIFRHYFSDAEITSPDFLKEVNKTFKAIRPFFDHMSEILTTDLNGELIV